MKTKTLLFAMAFLFGLTVISQTIELSFNANYYGLSTELDSVLVENLTQEGDITLVNPDLTLTLVNVSVKEANTKGSFAVSPNHPNPFTGKTTFRIFMPEEDLLQVLVFNSLGQKVLFYKRKLEGGNHSFSFYSGNERNYFVTASVKGSTRSIKLVNLGNTSGKECSLTYLGKDNTLPDYKAHKGINEFVFSLGDKLRFIGYATMPDNLAASDVMEDAPENNQTYTFEIIEGLPCPETPSVTYEGQMYTTVQVGDQCWFKENLNVGTLILGSQDMTDDDIIEKYCYNDELDNCAQFGGLYQWDEMMQYITAQGAQGICPDGWHVPTDFADSSDWCILTKFIDTWGMVECLEWNYWTGVDLGIKMKSTTSWDYTGTGNSGTNISGFTALSGGVRTADGFEGAGDRATFWSSSNALPGSGSWGLLLKYDMENIFRLDYFKTLGRSVRCIKDN